MIVEMKKLNIIGLISEKNSILEILRLSGCFEPSTSNSTASIRIHKKPTANTATPTTTDTTSSTDASPTDTFTTTTATTPAPTSTSNSTASISIPEVDEGEGLCCAAKRVDYKHYEALNQRLQTLKSAIERIEKSSLELKELLKENASLAKKGEVDRAALPSIKGNKPLFSSRRDITEADLADASVRGDEILSSARRILDRFRQAENLKNLFERNKKESEQLAFYKNVDVPLSSITESKNMFMTLGTLEKAAAATLQDRLKDNQSYIFRSFKCDKKHSIIFLSSPIELREEALTLLSSLNFSRCELKSDAAPLAAIANLTLKNKEIYNERLSLLYENAHDHAATSDIKLYYDCIVLELEAIDTEKNILETKRTFSIEGWVPSESAANIVERLKSASAFIECEIIDAPSETPPTLTRSNALVSPYEAVTNMYSPPSPYERDPNPFVGFFFFIFFGIMIGDAIYGIALFAITFILMRCYKMETGFKKLMMIMCMGGVSAFIWGAVYNSWAAATLPYNPVLNPVTHPFDFLIISLGLGYIQIMFGFMLRLVANLCRRDFVSALAEAGWKLLIMLGTALNIPSALSMFDTQLTLIKLPVPSTPVLLSGLVMVVIGLAGMLMTGGRNKETIGGKIVSGVGSWYDLVGLTSDILSYCRLFGLALSGAIIGMVANILAKDVLFPIPVVGYPLGVVVAIFFHVFNLALACLGAYVHNSRLQFVEFFGKFYEGGGRTFSPMGRCTVYTSLKNN